MSDYFERFIQYLMIDPARPVARLVTEYQGKYPFPAQIQGLARAQLEEVFGVLRSSALRAHEVQRPVVALRRLFARMDWLQPIGSPRTLQAVRLSFVQEKMDPECV